MTSQVERQANLLSNCVTALRTWKELIDTYLEGEEKTSEIEQVENIVKEFCLLDFTTSKSLQACEEVAESFNGDGADSNINVNELYKEKLSNECFNKDYEEHRIWKEVFHGITDHDVEAVTNDSQSEQPTEYEEMADSVFYSNVFTPPVDPISKMVIKNPYKNVTCGHVYEYKFILQYIKSMKNKAKCPYIGCGNTRIAIADLQKDTNTQNKINKYLSENSQESPSEDTEDE